MLNISLQEAQHKLPELVTLVEQGEEVCIISNNKSKIRLVSLTDKPSKWAVLAQEIETNPALNLDGYSDQLKKDTLELRENFIFSSEQNGQ